VKIDTGVSLSRKVHKVSKKKEWHGLGTAGLCYVSRGWNARLKETEKTKKKGRKKECKRVSRANARGEKGN